jgi:hypothetical protein
MVPTHAMIPTVACAFGSALLLQKLLDRFA